MLVTSNENDTPYVKKNDAKDANLLRKSAHNNLFALANSAMLKVDIIGYKTAWWKIMFRVVEIVIPVCLAGWGFLAIFTALRKKEEEIEMTIGDKKFKGKVTEE